MKRFSIVLVLAFLTTLPIAAQKEDHLEQIAITHLKRIAANQIDLTKHTALSPNCSVNRRKEIRNRLEFLQKNYLHTEDTFITETIHNSPPFSAVLVRADHPSTPLTSRIITVSLLQQNGIWKATPLLGSFDNTGYGYDEELINRAKKLEQWMSSEAIKRETAYRAKARQQFQSRLTQTEKQLQLETLDHKQSVTNFIELHRQKNLLKILAAMGASSEQLIRSLEETIDIITRGLKIKVLGSAWHMMTHPTVTYEVMNIDEKRQEIAVGFYNPMISRPAKVIYFPFKEKQKKIFIRLSPSLTSSLQAKDAQWRMQLRNRRDDERELARNLPEVILKRTPPIISETPEKLIETLLPIIRTQDFRKAIALLPAEELHLKKGQEPSNILSSLSTLWKQLVKLQNHAKFNVVKEGNLALVPLQYSPLTRPGTFKTINLWLLRNEHGWHLIPKTSLQDLQDPQITKTIKTLQQKIIAITQAQVLELSKKILSQVFKVDPANIKTPATKKDIIHAFKNYRNHLSSEDHETALSCCATLKNTDDTRTVRNFKYALRAIKDHLKEDKILGVNSSGGWSGISIRTQSKLSGTHEYPLYLCIQTKQGTKILLDIDLRHASNKGRSLLNAGNWVKLEKSLPANMLKDIKAIFEKHEQLATKDIEEEKKLHE